VRELREAGYARGLAPADLVAGDALALPFPNGAFDVVCAFGVLHHVKTPDRAVDEMLRVARLAIFVSDSNNFGQGGSMVRLLKQGLNAVGLWPVVNWLKTRGRGYSLTDGDGLAYSYSVFNSYPRIRRGCRLVHCMNTRLAGPNLYRTATHVAVMGIK
jgi:SAM-dependent methyltransferase